MHIGEFTFHRPATLAEACSLSRELGDGAWFLAGGTDVVPDLKRRLHAVGHLISLAAIGELRGIREVESGIEIGALTTHAEVATNQLLRAILPALSDAASTIGGHQVRSQATIGGNWCGGVPCADTPPASIVGRARAVIQDGESERELNAAEFITAPRETALAHGEILTSIRVPNPAPHSGTSFQRFTLRKGLALAVASVAVGLELDGDKIAAARVALGAVGPTPIVARTSMGLLEGKAPSDELFEEAALAAAADAKPITDIRGSADYRREIVTVLTQRALKQALARAHGEVQSDGQNEGQSEGKDA
jgi:aerobic carbon-monoxide dehydrogenase medium subunit